MGGMFAGHDQSGKIATNSYYGHLLCVLAVRILLQLQTNDILTIFCLPKKKKKEKTKIKTKKKQKKTKKKKKHTVAFIGSRLNLGKIYCINDP